jgi:hypothetical protein
LVAEDRCLQPGRRVGNLDGMMIGDYVLLGMAIVVLACLIALTAVAVWDMRLVLERRLFRFRLRTLLLVAVLFQLALAVGSWWQQRGIDAVVVFATLGLGGFGLWAVWRVFDDLFGTSALQRFKPYIHRGRIGEPPKPKGVEPPPQQQRGKGE